MSTPVRIKVAGNEAKVSDAGELLVAAYSYDTTKFVELAAADTSYNFYFPKAGHKFVITGIVAKADKQVSSTVDATVIVYEATEEVTTTVDRVIFEMAMVEGDIATLLPLNIEVGFGKFINAKTTDDDIHMTIMGFYTP